MDCPLLQAEFLVFHFGITSTSDLWLERISRLEDQPETILFEGLFNAGSYKILNNAQTKKHANGGVIRFRQGIIEAGQKLASLKEDLGQIKQK